jgi:hypothetical protein
VDVPGAYGVYLLRPYLTVPTELIQAVSIMRLLVPLTIFFAQRFFLQGVVITGVDK